MRASWMCWIVAGLIGASVVYELLSGRARLRGIGVFTRQERPGAYWGSILLKLFMGAMVVLLGLYGPERLFR
jgi:hypothetical protein